MPAPTPEAPSAIDLPTTINSESAGSGDLPTAIPSESASAGVAPTALTPQPIPEIDPPV